MHDSSTNRKTLAGLEQAVDAMMIPTTLNSNERFSEELQAFFAQAKEGGIEHNNAVSVFLDRMMLHGLSLPVSVTTEVFIGKRVIVEALLRTDEVSVS